MKKAIVILFILLIPFNALADDRLEVFGLDVNPLNIFNDWDKTDMVLLGVYSTIRFIDWGQTRDIAENPEFIETNPILGPEPTIDEVNKWAIEYWLQNILVAELVGNIPDIAGIPVGSIARKGFLTGQINVHYKAVKNNIEIGVGFNAPF